MFLSDVAVMESCAIPCHSVSLFVVLCRFYVTMLCDNDYVAEPNPIHFMLRNYIYAVLLH